MKFRQRLALLSALAALGTTLALVGPTIANADPSGVVAEGRDVVAVTPLEGAPTSEETRAAFAGQTAGRRSAVGPDGELLVLGDADYTSAESTRRLDGGVEALALTPKRFDLRDASFATGTGSFVTKVKSQNPFGVCWAFGVASAAESSLHSEWYGPVSADGELDLSEKQLGWFSWMPVVDGAGNQDGEGHRVDFGPDDGSGAYYNLGGNFTYASSLFSLGIGPTDESIDSALEYHNAEGDYVTNAEGMDEPAADGDWSVPERLRHVASFELEESFRLPLPASYEADGDTGYERYVFNRQGVDAIKEQLLAGRGVAVGFCADASMPGEPSETHYLNEDTWAHYTYESPREGAVNGGPDHAVCIVGYDDDYSRENFVAEHRPPADGAFIVKNNWGSLDSDYGNRSDWGIDGSGYFYLSYYDKSITTLESYDFVTPMDADLAYGADGQGHVATVLSHAYLPAAPTSDVYADVTSMAEIFDPPASSVVRSVSIQTDSFDTDVRFDVYRLREGASDPTDGTLLWSRDESFAYGGVHRVELETPIVVAEGDRLGVVVTTRLPDGSYELVQNADYSEVMSRIQRQDPTQWVETVVNPGESFFGSPTSRVEFSDGSYAYGGYGWTDFSDEISGLRAAGEAALEASGIPGLLEDRDAAYEAALLLSEDDPGYDEAWAAYDEAATTLSEAVSEAWADVYFALYRYDNYAIGLSVESIDPADPLVAATGQMLRLYNPNTGEHLYTMDANEKATLVGLGWRDEGLGWISPAKSNTPVYRLYNPFSGEHLYTTDAVERASLTDAGWSDEGVGFFSDNSHNTAVYRLFNPLNPEVAAHHFTTDRAERDALVASHGWRDESIAWYGA